MWFHNGQPLSTETASHAQLSDDGRVLVISSVLVADTGLYVCVATNEAGEAEKHFDLQVWGESLYTCNRCGVSVYL